MSYSYDSNEESKAAKYETLINTTIPFYMDKLENVVSENNGYFVNGKVIQIIVFSVVIDDKSYCINLRGNIYLYLKSSDWNMSSVFFQYSPYIIK